MRCFITDPAVLDLAQGLLHIVLWSSVLFGMATTFSGMMRASGAVFMPLALLIFAIAAIEVPSAIILSRAIGLKGIWAAYPITFCAMFLLQMSYYMLIWRKRGAAVDLTAAARRSYSITTIIKTVDARGPARHNASDL